MTDMDLQDSKAKLNDALRDLQASRGQLRESVVMTVMRRNKLADDITRIERMTADLETKAALAEQINNLALAAELRTERASQQTELERLRVLFQTADQESETAKLRLPQEESQLRQRIGELQAQLSQMESGRVLESTTGSFANNPDTLFNRAADKIREMQNEAAARGEVAGVGQGLPPIPQPPTVERVEAMLNELEARTAETPEPASHDALAAPVQYLELDTAPPASPEITETPAPESPTEVSATQTLEPPTVTVPEPAEVPAPVLPDFPSPEMEPSEAENEIDTPSLSLPAEPEAEIEAAETAAAPAFEKVTQIKRGRIVEEPSGRIRVAGIGTGGIFRGAHLPAYADIPQAQLVALCDPDKTAQDLAYRRYQSLMEVKIRAANDAGDFSLAERYERDLETVQICDDISEVIELIKPDVVDIATQPLLHVPLSIQALEAGIHVMCEKPISRSWLESQRLIEAIGRTGKLYQHNENWLWERDYYTAKKLIDSGAIGEPILMFLATAHGGPEGNPKFWNSDFGGGGALLDNGIHAIGAAWFMSGLDKKPTLVKAAEPFGMSIRMPDRILDGRYQKVLVEDDAHILIRFENPDSLAWTTAHVEGSWSHRDSPDTAIIGTTGKIVFQDEEKRRYAVVMDSYDRESRRIEVSGPTWSHWPSSHYGEMLNFIECVRNNVPSICTAEFGAECSAIVGASYLSEKNGKRAVAVEEFKQFASDIAAKYPNDPTGADNALVDELLSAVREG